MRFGIEGASIEDRGGLHVPANDQEQGRDQINGISAQEIRPLADPLQYFNSIQRRPKTRISIPR